MSVAYSGPLLGLARFLIVDGVLSEEIVAAAVKKSAEQKISLLNFLIRNHGLKEEFVSWKSAFHLGVNYLDLVCYNVDYVPPKIDLKYARSKRVLPIAIQGNPGAQTLFVAVSAMEVFNFNTLVPEFKFKHQVVAVFPVVVDESKLLKLIDEVISKRDLALSMEKTAQQSAFEIDDGKELTIDDTEEDLFSALESDNLMLEETASGGDSSSVDDQPVVKYIQKVLLDAINSGVSDIHFEPYEKSYRVRYRQDGVLQEASQPPLAIKDKLASRIKVISKLNIAEKRIPQDGRFKLPLSRTRAIDFRVSTCPTLFGEKIVMRILDPSAAQVGIDALGYDPHQKKLLLDAINRPYGMVLVTGPTGSGKTVSLYTCLNILNQPGINISTAEDPAEISLFGINQVNVNDAAGLTFSAALKSFLRQDPDIIMVGEIRDLETAGIAIKAAQTGHLVLSTLHTNDAPQTLTRLMNMGIPAFNIASAVILITAQRLGRRLCVKCKEKEIIPKEALIQAGFNEEEVNSYNQEWFTYKAVGCPECKGKGYKGRVGIYQVMPITEAIQEIILKGGNSLEIARQSEKEGVENLRRAGLNKVKAGITSLEEIVSVTNV